MDTGEKITRDYVKRLLGEEATKLFKEIDSKKTKDYKKAVEFYGPDILNDSFDDFITFKAYDETVKRDSTRSMSGEKL